MQSLTKPAAPCGRLFTKQALQPPRLLKQQARRQLIARAVAAPAPPSPNLDKRIQELTSALHHVETATTRDAATLDALQQGLTQLRSDWQSKQQQLTQLCELVSELRTASTDVVVLTHQVTRAQAKVENMQLLMQARELEIQQLTERLHALQPAAMVGANNVAVLERPVVSGRQWLDQPLTASNLAYIDGTWLQRRDASSSDEEDAADFWALEPVPGMVLNVPVAKLAAWAQKLKPTSYVTLQTSLPEEQRPVANAMLAVTLALVIKALAELQ